MCGICGIINIQGHPIPPRQIEDMAQALVHRGPDEEGFYFSPNESSSSPKVGLGFRRLSIIDLKSGQQPMRFQNLTIVFNGEIYNYRELKKECEAKGHQFLTSSDTEVLLHLFSIYGERVLEKLRGMFAFAIWDEKNKELFAARDPLGIKPFFYFFNGTKFIFSSETKSLFQSGEIPLEFDPISVLDFFRYRFAPAPHTVIKNVYKIPPAHFLKLKNGQLIVKRYWESGQCEPLEYEESNLEEELLTRLEESVRLQMVSDVPLGAFLSGGVDSSLIVALMARNSKEKIQTFSIGFEKGTGVDESRYARELAQAIGTDHHEYILTEKDLESVDKILSNMTEPVADPTILPTAILSQFARQHVKVVLTGEGGDELFAGYNRYKSVLYSQWVQSAPKLLQTPLTYILRKAGKGDTFKQIPNLNSENWFRFNQDFKPEQMEPLFKNLDSTTLNDSYLMGLGQVPIGTCPKPQVDLLNSILNLETETALAERLLMKVDMATMGASLEARPPFLDHTLVDFVSKIPAGNKIKFFKGKYILRSIASKLIPKEIAWRRKHGFIVPLAKWIRACPKETILNLLNDSVLDKIELFDKKSIQTLRDKIYNRTCTDTEIALFWPIMVLTAWTQHLKKS